MSDITEYQQRQDFMDWAGLPFALSDEDEDYDSYAPQRAVAHLYDHPETYLTDPGWRVAKLVWKPINDYPGDQAADLPGTDDLFIWATIGTDHPIGWTWTITVRNDALDQWDAAGGKTDTEQAAKDAVARFDIHSIEVL